MEISNMRGSQHQVRKVGEAMEQHSIVSVADTSGNITYVNDLFCQVSKYSREELLGQNHRILKSGIHAPQFFDDIWLVISSGSTWHGEVCNRDRNGGLYWVETTIVPDLDENGLPRQYISVNTEITRIKQVEEALTRSAAELELKIKAQSTRLLWIGELYRIGQRALSEEKFEVVYQRILEHVVQGFEGESGLLALIDEDVTFFDGDADPTIVATVNLPDLVTGHEVAWGQCIGNLVAKEGEGLPSGKNAKLFDPESDKTTLSMCLRLKKEDQVFGFLRITRTEKLPPYTKGDLEEGVLITPLISVVIANLILHFESRQRIAMLSEINKELVLTSQRLQDAQDHLMQSEKMASIGQLAAGVAHEINNPIGYVYSNLGTLEKYVQDTFGMIDIYEQAESSIVDSDVHAKLVAAKVKLDIVFLREDLRALMDESKEGITRVKKIVQNLKDFSHVDATDEWHFTDLHQGLDSTLNIVSNEIKYKADVIKDYGELPEVECLSSQINQVFMNLLVNAAHAIEERGTITIRSGRQGDEVWVEIADTGKGIDPEHLKKIFDPFFTTKPIGKGTGLGLSLSYGIIKKHHGRIEVQSEVGKGTTFRVCLPIKQSKDEQK
jgi:PAS domain S-box-containing protein